jgi:secreted Zn-dependent insulinase-like peptidase
MLEEKVEKYFTTPYTSINLEAFLTKDVFNNLKERKYQDIVKFPPMNEFIPKNMEIVEYDAKFQHPAKVEIGSVKTQVWYQADDKYKVPKANICLLFVFNLNAELSNSAYLNIIIDYLDALFEERIGYQGLKAGMEYRFEKFDYFGIQISLYGFSSKILDFLCKIIEFMYKTIQELDETLFKMILENRIKYYEKEFEDAEKQTQNYLKGILIKHSNFPEEIHEWLKTSANFEDFVKFTQNLLKSKLSHNLIYYHGNLTVTDVSNNAITIEKMIHASSIINLEPFELKKSLARIPIKLASGEVLKLYKQQAKNVNNKNGIVIYYVDLAADNVKNRTLSNMLNQLLDSEIFDELRTKQQIGYISNSYSKTYSDLRLGNEIWVTSTKLKVEEILDKIKKFLDNFVEVFMKKFSDKDFEELKQSMISIRAQPYLSIEEISSLNWGEILDQTYVFQRKVEETEILTNLTNKEFIEWVTIHLADQTQHFPILLEPKDPSINADSPVKPKLDYNYYQKDWKF